MEEIVRNLFGVREGENIVPVIVSKESVIFASSEGRFFTLQGREKAQPINKRRGYAYVYSGDKAFQAHRLVAKAFIPNPENKPQVNHKNGIKTDNRVENLEWVTNGENQVHAVKNGLRNQPKETRKYQDGRLKRAITKIVDGVYSIKEASRLYGIPYSTISVGFMRLRNGQKSFLDEILSDEQKNRIIQKPLGQKWNKTKE